MKNNIYLVTGAAGFLGSNICRQLITRGERVRALIMNGDPAEKYVPKGVEIVHGDLLDETSLDVFFDTGEVDDVYADRRDEPQRDEQLRGLPQEASGQPEDIRGDPFHRSERT